MLDSFRTQTQSSQAHRAIAYFLAFTLGVIVVTIERALMPRFALSTSLIIFASMIIIAVVSGLFIGGKHVTSKIVALSTTFLLTNIAMLFIGFAVYLLPLALAVSLVGALPVLHQKQRSARKVITLSASVIVTAIIFTIVLDYVGFTAQRIMLNSFYS